MPSTRPTPTRRPTKHTQEELDDQLEHAMTSSASTTQRTTSRQHRHDQRTDSLPHLVQKRNSTPDEDRQTKNHQDDESTINKDEIRQQIASIPSNICGIKNTTSINTRRKKVIMGHMQDKTSTDKYVRQGTVECSRVKRGVLQHDDEDTRTRTRGQLRSTKTHNDAVHDAGTQQRHQSTQKRQSCRHERCQCRNDPALHQKSPHTHVPRLCNKVIKNIRRIATKLAGYNDQSHFYERGPIVTFHRPICSIPFCTSSSAFLSSIV